MEKTYQVSTRIRLSRWIVLPIFRGLFHILSRVKIVGVENVPPHGPYLIAINHVSLFEPPLVLSFWPVAPEAMGASDIWHRRGQASLARIYGAIPVHRGKYDRVLIDTTVSVLRAGFPLMIAPEGARSHVLAMRQAHPGVAYLVEQSQAPVVPVGVIGMEDDFLRQALRAKRPAIEMRIGPPVYLPPVTGKGEERRIARQRNADLIMAHIAALLPEEYRGYYADHSLFSIQKPM